MSKTVTYVRKTLHGLLLALGILFFQSRQFIQQEAEERATSVLNTTTQRVRNYMSAVETATNANTRFVEEYFHPDSLMAISRRIVAMNRHVYACGISAEPDMFPQYGRHFSVYTIDQGDTIVSLREPAYDYFKKDWYKAPLDSGKACWVDPYHEYTEGALNPSEIIASYSKPLYASGKWKEENGQRKIVGVISTDLSFRRLSEAICRAPLSQRLFRAYRQRRPLLHPSRHHSPLPEDHFQ